MINGVRAKPFAYQKEGVYQIEDFGGVALLADEMGLGKTLQALWVIRRNPEWGPALLVVPSIVKYNWEHEAALHVGLQASVCEGQTPPSPTRASFHLQAPLTIINYDILHHWLPYLEAQNFKTIVFDECQNIANRDTKRAAAARKLSRKIPHRLGLSGTPLMNRPAELWSILNILWPEHYKSFWSFGQEFCNPRWTPWGWTFEGACNSNKLHRDLRRLGMVRRLKVDVLKDLPEKVRRIIPCELADRQEYEDASRDFMGWIKKNMAHKVRSVGKVEKMAKVGYLLRLCAKLKMKSVVEWSNRFLEETDEKLALFAIHKKAIAVLQRRINTKSVTIDGSVSGRLRKTAVDQFQTDAATRGFIGNIKAAGTGITITAASTLGIVEMWWNPAAHIQVEARIHRIGQTRPSWINYFVAGDTVEEDLCKLLQRRQVTVSSVLDGGPLPQDLNIYDELINLSKGKVYHDVRN